jgi:hypothetical protein
VSSLTANERWKNEQSKETDGDNRVVAVSEQELNEIFPQNLPPLPSPLPVPLGNGRAAQILLGTPWLDLDSGIQDRVSLFLPHQNTIVTQPGQPNEGPFFGVIRVDVNLGLDQTQTIGRVFLDFNAIAQVDPINSGFPTTDHPAIVQGITFVLQIFGELELMQTNLSPTDQLDTRVIVDPVSVDGDCLLMMIGTLGTNLDPANFTTSMVLPDRQVVIVTSGLSLLRDDIRPSLEERIRAEAVNPQNLPEEIFAEPCVLVVPIDIGGATITNMEATIGDGLVNMIATATASGFGWTATGSLRQSVNIGVDEEGRITQTPIPEEPVPIVQFEVEWWVYLLGIVLGGISFGPIGAAFAAASVAIVDAVGDGLAFELVSSQFPESEEETPRPIPGVVLEEAVLEDNLCFYGRLERDPALAEQTVSENVIELLNHRNLDLETGQVQGPVNVLNEIGWFWGEEGMLTYNADLGWADTNQGSGLWIQGIARAKLLNGVIFDYIRHEDIVNTFVMGSALLDHDNPLLPATDIPSAEEDGVVIAMRTGAGRYAKCLLWRDLSRASLWVRYVTYTEGFIDPSSGSTEYHPGTSIFDAHPELKWAKHKDDESDYYYDRLSQWEDDYEPPEP